MIYLKIVSNGFIMGLHIVQDGGNCEREEYESLLNLFAERPTAPDGYVYLLREDNLEWKLAEVPVEDEEATAEDYENALADLGVRV